MRYVGLTDDLEKAFKKNGQPSRWRQIGPFASQVEAEYWKEKMISAGSLGAREDSGWHYGYTYTMLEEAESSTNGTKRD